LPASGPSCTSNPASRPDSPIGAGHVPVLYQPVMDALEIRLGGRYVDGTVGAGGHAAGILDAAGPGGRLLGLDRDPDALSVAAKNLARFGDQVVLVHGSFAEMRQLATRNGFVEVDGIVLDLGLSSLQMDRAERGFSFQHDGPLDMRFDPSAGLTAADLVNGLSEQELADLLYRLGEERDSRSVARAIVAARPLRSTYELATVTAGALRHREHDLHPATKTFMALRIAVNQELEALSEALPQALELLAPGGRLVVIAFHSLEDRIVKRYLAREARDCICPPRMPVCSCGHRAMIRLLNRKPIRPDAPEVAQNPRSRSARLRLAERVPTSAQTSDIPGTIHTTQSCQRMCQ